MSDRIQLKRGDAADWTSANPVLSEGEVGLELDTGLMKVGDGATAWNSLSYQYDALGTDNSTDVTLSGTPDYITITGQVITRAQIDLAADVTGTLPHGNLGSGGGGATKFLREDSSWQTLGGGTGDALVANNLDQFADVTQTSGQTLAITASTTLGGGFHSGTNSGDVSLSGTPDYITITGQTITRGSVDLAADVTGTLPHGNLGSGGGGATKFLREDSSWQTIASGGDALTSNSLDQFADVTQTAGKTFAITDNASISGTNSGDVTLSGTPDYITITGQVITRGSVDLAADVTGDLPYANIAQATAEKKLLGRGAGTGGDWEEITVSTGLTMTGTTLTATGGAGDALVANSLDQFADVTQTSGQTLAITTSTTLGGGSHSGTNTGDVSLSGTPDYITISGQTITRAQVDVTTDITGTIPHGNLGSGGGGATKFLREDSSWQTVSGSGLTHPQVLARGLGA